MAEPRQRETDGDEALAILRRLEPTLAQIQTELKDLNTRVSRLEGQVSQLPGIWQMASLFTALLGAALGAGAALVAILG